MVNYREILRLNSLNYTQRQIVNFHIISDWFNHNKTDEKERNNVKIMSC